MLLAMVNLDKWNALPKYYQNVLEQAGHDANNWMIAKYDAVNPMALRKLLAGGAKLHAFPPPVMEASFKAAKELHSEVAATNENFKKVYESMTASRTTATSGSRSPNSATTSSWRVTRRGDRLATAHTSEARPRNGSVGGAWFARTQRIKKSPGAKASGLFVVREECRSA